MSKKKNRTKSPPEGSTAVPPAGAREEARPSPIPRWAGAAARTIVGAVLLVAGLQKASGAPEEFAAVIDAYRLLPPDQILFFAKVLPWVQIVLGLSMTTGYLSRPASAAGGALLLVFIGALLSVIARGIPLADCGCFNGVHLSPAQTAALDSVLAGLAYFAYRNGGAFAPVDSWIRKGT